MLESHCPPLDVIRGGVRVLPVLSFVGAPGQEPPHEAIVLEQMLNQEGVVRARPLEQFLKWFGVPSMGF